MLRKFLIIFYFINVILLPGLVLAQENTNTVTYPEVTGIDFKPSIDIPGSQFTATTTVTGSTLAEYIVAVYRYGGMFAGIVAMFMLVYAGWEWLLAGGNASKISKARDKINGVLVGLALLFGGYVLLSLISQRLVNFSSLKTALPTMEKTCPVITDEKQCTKANCVWVPATEEQLQDNPEILGYCKAPWLANCPSESLLKDIKVSGIVVSDECQDPRLTGETIAKLEVAKAALQAGETLVINGAYRTTAYQQYLYDCYSKKRGNICPSGCGSCNKAAKPSCSAPHQTGTAVDICLVTSQVNTCDYVKEMYTCSSANIPTVCGTIPGLYAAEQRLKTIMENAGFNRTVSDEWWHFQ